MRLVAGPLAELQRHFTGLQLNLLRGTAGEIGELLQKGRAELAVAGPLGQAWERLDSWPLFEERYVLAVGSAHRWSDGRAIDMRQLAEERILIDTACESADAAARTLQDQGLDVSAAHRIGSQQDVVALLGANLGAAFLPHSALAGTTLRQVPVKGLEMSREVSLYGVAGRQRSAAAEAFMKLLRARDWSGAMG
jgi:DNA-binding transcriptional LysR family regulator